MLESRKIGTLISLITVREYALVYIFRYILILWLFSFLIYLLVLFLFSVYYFPSHLSTGVFCVIPVDQFVLYLLSV
jgi:hypothetical protein